MHIQLTIEIAAWAPHQFPMATFAGTSETKRRPSMTRCTLLFLCAACRVAADSMPNGTNQSIWYLLADGGARHDEVQMCISHCLSLCGHVRHVGAEAFHAVYKHFEDT